jgi:endonuclease/exonuclease/phosphatase family metal-dependent hydrolase
LVLRMGGGTTFACRLHGIGYDTGYSAVGSFHFGAVTIAGRTLELKYKADNDDSGQGMDVRLAIHETPIYEIDSADFANPNVMNLMAYNIQFLPLGVVGLPQAADRGDLLPAQFSPYQDVIIFEEVFDPLPRLLNLVPAMEAAGYIYNSGILNDYLPFNGGVIIFSKWPIERTDEYDFELCGPSSQDCLANKGIMYARVLKLGKPYNIFGTHFDAGGDSADIAAKTLQYAEMRDFIAAQGIPAHEAVLWGGDLNTDANNSHNLYTTMRDSLDFVIPNYTGFPSSTMNRDTGDVIDHVFADPRYLLPLEGEVFITTFRSIESTLWDLSDFSDHRCAISRFRFPDLSVGPGDQDLCPGEQMAFQSTADIPVTRTWYHDGAVMPGLTGGSITIFSSTFPDSGLYELQMQYSRTYSPGPGPVNQLLYPNGPVTYTAAPRLRAGYVTVSFANCPIAAADGVQADFTAYPNPAGETVHLQKSDAQPADWQLCDLRGTCLRQGKWLGESLSIDLDGLAGGTYLVQLHERSGRVTSLRVSLVR